MPSYIVPAEGPVYIREGKPASAFSRGDILVLNSSSSLSRTPEITTTLDIVGVALADSNDSIRGKVTYAIPHADTVWWSTCTPGSTFTRGANVNFNYDAASHMIANGSTGTVRAVCVKGVADIEQPSGESRIQIQFIHNAGALLFS